MSFDMRVREARWRLAGHYRRPLGAEWIEPLRGAHGLEIGGPTPMFGADGLLPIYPALGTLDGIQVPLAHNLWHGDVSEGPYETGQPGLNGRLWLREATSLAALAPDAYDVVISSHVIEHLANPLRALGEWLRVLRPGALLLTALPHKEGCADHRRPTTSLAHLLQDERDGVGEDDLTHVDEAIALHDIERDPPAGTRAAYRERTLANLEVRALHHHVWTTRSALRVFDHLGLEVVQVHVRWRWDIYVLCRAPAPGDPKPDNSAFLAPHAPFLRHSPFRADRAGDDGS